MSGPERMRCAVTAAENGVGWWATAVATQRTKRGATVDHGDLYGLAAELVATLSALEDLAAAMAWQTAGYGEGRRLRDDAGAEPMERLEEAGAAAICLRADLAVALRHANAFWSAIGHIGLAVEPPSAVDTGGGGSR